MSAVGDPDDGLPVGHVQQQRRDEAFPDVVGLDEFRQVTAEAGLQAGGQLVQAGVVVGQLAEGAEHQRGVADRGQALAPDVADQQPGAPAGAGGGVEIAADPGLVLGRQVPHGHPERAQALWEGAEQNLLHRLRDRPYLGQLPAVPLPDPAVEDDGDRDRQQGPDLRLVVGRRQPAVQRGDHHLRGHRRRADQRGEPGACERGGDRGGDHQQRPEVDVGRGGDVHDRNQHDEPQRKQHQEMHRLPGPPDVRQGLSHTHVSHLAPSTAPGPLGRREQRAASAGGS